jgi:hypothetical protein
MLQNKRMLKDIFKFLDEDQSWTSCRAQVVTQAHPGDFRPFDIVTSEPAIPPAGVAFCARSPEDVRQWITGGREAGWCVPGKHMGHDVMTWIRLDDGEILLLAVRVEPYLNDDLDTVTTERIPAAKIHVNTPEQKKERKMVNAALKAISTLPEAFTQGQYDILRVIIAFPVLTGGRYASGYASRYVFRVEDVFGQDDYILALSSRTALVAVLATIPHGSSIMEMLKETLQRTRAEADLNGDTEPERVSKRRKIARPKRK